MTNSSPPPANTAPITPGEITITVVNRSRKKKPELNYTYIGRPSVYGNPFYMDDEEERDLSCDRFAQYFNERLQRDPHYVEAMHRLKRIAMRQGYLKLECFCAPKRCHGDTIAEHVRKLIEEECQKSS